MAIRGNITNEEVLDLTHKGELIPAQPVGFALPREREPALLLIRNGILIGLGFSVGAALVGWLRGWLEGHPDR